MNKLTWILAVVLAVSHLIATPAVAQTAPAVSRSDSKAAAEVTQMLRDFLAAVPRNDRQVFDNFFADDVIYTRGAGVTINKAEIMKGVGQQRAVNEPVSTYEADDLTVHVYGKTVVVNFRLVQHTEEKGAAVTNYFRNTGTFLNRHNRWQVVAWQATRVPAETR